MNKILFCFIIFFLLYINKNVYSQNLAISNVEQIRYSINITGLGFKSSDLSIFIDSIDIKSTCYVNSDTYIMCTDLPTGVKSGYLEIRNVDGAKDSHAITFSPYIIGLSKTKINPSGENITVTGRFFEELNPFTGAKYIIYGLSGNSLLSCQYISDSAVIVSFPSGSGPNFSMRLIYSELTEIVSNSNTVTYSYASPNILALSQSNDTFTLIVENFSPDISLNLIYFNNQPPFNPTTLNSTSFTFTLAPTSQNGKIYFTSAGQKSNNISVNLAPIIMSISPSTNLNPDGSTIVTIGGYYFSNVNYYTGASIDFNFYYILDSVSVRTEINNCSSIESSNRYLCTGIKGLGYSGKLSIRKYDTQLVESNQIGFSFQAPVVIKSTSLYYQEPGNITITANFFSPKDLKVQIENVECSNAFALDIYQIQCYYDASVPKNENGDALLIFLSSNLMTGSNRVFLYNEYYSCPNNCTDEKHGKCNQVNGQCVCNDGYESIDCSNSKQTPLPPPETNDKGETILGGNFTVSIIYLREIDIYGQQVKLLSMNSIIWDNVTKINSNESYYRGTFINDSAVVELNVTYYKDSDDYDFAGDIFSISSNSIKYIIKVSNWEFSSSLSTFQLIYNAQTVKFIEYGCNNQIIETNSTSSASSSNNGNLQSISWFQIVSGSSIMDARFSKRYFLDSVVKKSSVTILPLNDPIYSLINETAANSSDSSFNILTSINTQYFEKDVILDPSFQSLINPSNNDNCEDDNNLKVILISVLCSVFGAAIIFATVFTIYRKHKINLETKSMQAKLKSLK